MRDLLNPQPVLISGRYRGDCEMESLRCRSVPVLWVCVCLCALVSAQITFSRDWTGGKRAAPHLALDCGQFTKLCRHFVHELKQAMTSEMGGKRQRDDLDKPPIYDDE